MFALFGRISPAQAKVVLSSRDKATNKPVKVTRVLPDPNVSPFGHTLLAILFYGLFIAYIVIAVRDYIDQPPTTSISQVDSNDYSVVPAFNVRIGVECKVDDSTVTSGAGCGDMLLNVNYTNYPMSPCHQSGKVVVTREGTSQVQNIAFSNGAAHDIKMTPHNASSSQRFYYNVPLCFTAQEPLNLASLANGGVTLPVSMIQVGFVGLNETGVVGAQMSVQVQYNNNNNNNNNNDGESSSNSNEHTVSRTINVNKDNSVRAVPISGAVERGLDNEVLAYVPSAEVIQFEGFGAAPSDAHLYRSDVMIVLQSKTVLRKREQVKSLWDLVSNIGSAFETLMGFMPFLLPVWSMLFFAKANWLSRFVASDDTKSDNASKYAEKESADIPDSPSNTNSKRKTNEKKSVSSATGSENGGGGGGSGTASAESSKKEDDITPVVAVVDVKDDPMVDYL